MSRPSLCSNWAAQIWWAAATLRLSYYCLMRGHLLATLRFYAVGSSLFLLSVCFCLCSLFYRDDVLCWLLLARPFLYAFHAHLRFPVDLVWFRLSCDHGWIRSGSVNVRKQQQQQLACGCSLAAISIIIIRQLFTCRVPVNDLGDSRTAKMIPVTT